MSSMIGPRRLECDRSNGIAQAVHGYYAAMPDVYDQADLYCAAFDWPLRGEVEWLMEQTGPVNSVLEPFCGHARYGPHFAARGAEYCGFDRSPAMLQRARLLPGMSVLQADAVDFSLPDRMIDLGWCPINSLAHLIDESDIVSHLRAMRNHLSRGGLYVVELELVNFHGDWPNALSAKSSWSVPQADGSIVHANWNRRRCDRAGRRCREVAHLWRCEGDRVVQEVTTNYTMRMWTADDLRSIAERAGFAIDRVHRPDQKA